MDLPSKENKTADEYRSAVVDMYEKLFNDPVPMAIIGSFEEIENAILTEKKITEKSKGWDGESDFY